MYNVSVPGSLMLLGEHSILHGGLSLVCSIDRRYEFTLIPIKSKNIIIFSKKYGYYKINFNFLIKKNFSFVLSAILEFKKYLFSGFILIIKNKGLTEIGLGSSSAIVVGTILILSKFLKIKLSKLCIFFYSKKAMMRVQKIGSGADIAASVFGGILLYRMNPFIIERLNIFFDIIVIYIGYKQKTYNVINYLENNIYNNCIYFYNLFFLIHFCVFNCYIFIKNCNYYIFGKFFNLNNSIMINLSLSDYKLYKLLNVFHNIYKFYGFKISGAGLGDCLIAISMIKNYNYYIFNTVDGLKSISIKIDLIGVEYV